MRELSPVERCRKNKWKKGTIINKKGTFENWKITGFGEYNVLGKQIDLEPNMTCGEKIIPLCIGFWKKKKKRTEDKGIRAILRKAELGSRVTQNSCTCTADQYGHAINPECILHGNKTFPV
jgi:hypothetical protein